MKSREDPMDDDSHLLRSAVTPIVREEDDEECGLDESESAQPSMPCKQQAWLMVNSYCTQLNGTLGPAMLVLPLGMSRIGAGAGVAMLFAFWFFSHLGLRRMLDSCARPRAASLGAAAVTHGPRVSAVADISVVLYFYGTCVSYLILIHGTLSHMLNPTTRAKRKHSEPQEHDKHAVASEQEAPPREHRSSRDGAWGNGGPGLVDQPGGAASGAQAGGQWPTKPQPTAAEQAQFELHKHLREEISGLRAALAKRDLEVAQLKSAAATPHGTGGATKGVPRDASMGASSSTAGAAPVLDVGYRLITPPPAFRSSGRG